MPSTTLNHSLDHRRSFSTNMHWLSRNSQKPSPERRPHLGHGATVVRTPEDALRNTNVRVTYDNKAPGIPLQPPPSPPTSPHLPPSPLPGEDGSEMLDDTPRRPGRLSSSTPSPVPSSPSSQHSSLRPSLKSRSSTAVEDTPHVPPVPSHVPLSSPVPPFNPILMSVPRRDADPAKIIVTLETCTTSFKSTLATLCSRPSHLAGYLTSLTRQHTNSQASSVYSTESADVEAYHNHLTSRGLLPSIPSATSLHMFLDRPSAPYAHILAFLRAPSTSPECPTTLPQAVQLSSLSHSISNSAFNAKLEALLELRDESAYLGLDSLHKLCTDEIRHRLVHAPKIHTRGNSQGSVNTMITPGLIPAISSSVSVHSQHASVHSLHTLIERVEGDLTMTKDMGNRFSQASDSLDERTVPHPITNQHLKHPSSVSLSIVPKLISSPFNTSPQSDSPTYSNPPPQVCVPRLQGHKKSESLISARMLPTPGNFRRTESRTRGRKGYHSPSLSNPTTRTVTGSPSGWL